jgi:hypothetical protein
MPHILKRCKLLLFIAYIGYLAAVCSGRLGVAVPNTGVTSFARTINESVTQLDRTELSLNESLACDPRDTNCS